MPLVTMRQLLDEAAAGGYGVAAFNVNNLEQIQGIMEAAQETQSPVIVQASRGARSYAGDNFLYHMMLAAAETYPDIPVALHQDHGNSPETCISAIELGFTSVMMDGSLGEDAKTPLDFEDNVAVTKQVVDYAHARGVTVEGELGTLGGMEDGVGSGEICLTDPAQAEEFVERTGVDALAVAIGTSHGAYKFSREPDGDILAMEIIEDIHRRLPDTHIVMHGSSSVPADIVERLKAAGGEVDAGFGVPIHAIQRGIEHGVRKVNIDTDGRLAITAFVREHFRDKPGRLGSARRRQGRARRPEAHLHAAHAGARHGRPRRRLRRRCRSRRWPRATPRACAPLSEARPARRRGRGSTHDRRHVPRHRRPPRRRPPSSSTCCARRRRSRWRSRPATSGCSWPAASTRRRALRTPTAARSPARSAARGRPASTSATRPRRRSTPRDAELVLATTNGAPAIVASAAVADEVLVASLLNLDAVSRAARRPRGRAARLRRHRRAREHRGRLPRRPHQRARSTATRTDAARVAEAVAAAYPTPLEALEASGGAVGLRREGLESDIAFCAQESIVDVVGAADARRSTARRRAERTAPVAAAASDPADRLTHKVKNYVKPRSFALSLWIRWVVSQMSAHRERME